ncbi:MAG TPA: NAD(+) diphosphatase [Acidimicrobiales bacterium]|jgi:NAD+ diphosphatase|nr:NAD(+) diphosphatase [Acidimicrobiales bacterium]
MTQRRETSRLAGDGDALFVPLLLPPDTPAISDTRWFWVGRGGIALSQGPPPGEPPVHFVGMQGTVACWAADLEPADPAPDAADIEFVDLRRLWGQVPDADWILAGRAVQLVEWARTHRYCGRCGAETKPAAGERAMTCADCELLAFPRLAPAVITVVHRGDEVLLARGVQFALPMYSCIAGFVEPGETLEQAVRREIREEVGVEVGEPRYVASQPWPFPHSLMIGFTAEWVAGEIEIDPREIADAQWFHRDALPSIPPPISIARRLIDGWAAQA